MKNSKELNPQVNIVYLRDCEKLYGEQGLNYATNGSIGLDLRADIDQDSILLPSKERVRIPTGIAFAPDKDSGLAGFVYSRSGLGAIQGVIVAQGVGVIDPDYRGEVFVVMLNTSDEDRQIKKGDRIAQLVFQPVCRVILNKVTALDSTDRGDKGFGHSGCR